MAGREEQRLAARELARAAEEIGASLADVEAPVDSDGLIPALQHGVLKLRETTAAIAMILANHAEAFLDAQVAIRELEGRVAALEAAERGRAGAGGAGAEG